MCQFVTQQSLASSLHVSDVSVHVCSLYERVGFERVAGWVDPHWLDCAEKGMIGPTRRVLYVRQVLGTVT